MDTANGRFRGYRGEVLVVGIKKRRHQVHVLSVCWQRLRLGAYLWRLSEHRANEIYRPFMV